MLLETPEYQLIVANNNSILSYKGPITNIIISEMGVAIRRYFAEDARLSRKVFSVFMELIQNMYFYSSEKLLFQEEENTIGTFAITKKEDHYIFSCSNLVEKSIAEILSDHCQTINSLERSELRKYKREQRDLPTINNSKGAGIGLIQVALLADNSLDIYFEQKDDEHTYFVISVKIDK